MISFTEEIPHESLAPLLSIGFDGEGHTFFDLLKYFEGKRVILTTFEEERMYSIVNDATGKRMSAPFRDNYKVSIINHLIEML